MMGSMNHVERFRAVMNFEPVDRLPMWEWAMWWDETIARWHDEGLPRELPLQPGFRHRRDFGLDPYQQFWFSTTDPTIEATQHHVEGIVANMDDYRRVRPRLFPNHAQGDRGHECLGGAAGAGRGGRVVRRSRDSSGFRAR